MLRDMATASLLGLASGGVADAFCVRLPHPQSVPPAVRRRGADGQLSARADRPTGKRSAAWPGSWPASWSRLLAVLLAGLVAAGELLFGLIWLIWGDVPGVGLLMGLSAVMLPYLLLICVAAQLTTMLYAAQHFTVPALAPDDAEHRVADRGLGGGAVVRRRTRWPRRTCWRWRCLWPAWRRWWCNCRRSAGSGIHFDYNWSAAREGLVQIGRNLMPMLVGLAVTQINTFNDSLIAWGLAAAPDGPQSIPWLGDAVRYPMQQGAVAALYYGDRLCEFPLGIVGMAVAVAIFPLLSRHAARGDRQQLGADMTLGLRLVLLSGRAGRRRADPAWPSRSRGCLFQRGQFRAGRHRPRRADDRLVCHRRLGVLRVAGGGAGLLCPERLRARRSASAAWMVGLNLVLNLTLIWPMAEAGLARLHLGRRRRAGVRADGDLLAPPGAAGLAAL